VLLTLWLHFDYLDTHLCHWHWCIHLLRHWLRRLHYCFIRQIFKIDWLGWLRCFAGYGHCRYYAITPAMPLVYAACRRCCATPAYFEMLRFSDDWCHCLIYAIITLHYADYLFTLRWCHSIDIDYTLHYHYYYITLFIYLHGFSLMMTYCFHYLLR